MPKEFSGKKFLVTYPRCYGGPGDILAWINNKRPIAKAIACLELHAPNEELISELAPTGEVPHVHLAIEFETKLTTNKVDWFDFEGNHPNVQTAKNWAACVNYCRKEGVIELEYFNCTAEEATQATQNEEIHLFDVARSLDGDREAWTDYCQAHQIPFAREMFVWGELHNPRRDRITIYQPPVLNPSKLPAGPNSEWMRDITITELPESLGIERASGIDSSRIERSLVILGPSGAGKSSFARHIAPKPALWCRHIDALRHFDAKIHKSVIIDELGFTGDEAGRRRWPLPSQVGLVDTELDREIHCRYNPAFIPAGVPTIFTFTDDIKFSRDFQIERRIMVINVYDMNIERGEDVHIAYWGLSNGAVTSVFN